MKKYKLIKEYPGSAMLDSIAKLYVSNNFDVKDTYNVKQPNGTNHLDVSKYILEKYPEFWQEIIQKDYEILSFIRIGDDYIINKKVNDMYMKSPASQYHIGYLLQSKEFKIYSVKRLSDLEIFTIGDLVTYGNYISLPITKFEIIENNLRVSGKKDKSRSFNNYYINDIQKVKQKLFTTEDKVDIYENDKYFTVNGMFSIIESSCNKNELGNLNLNLKRFSTKEAAKKYIICNKPCLCINDIKDNYNGLYSSLIKIVESRL